MRKGARSYKKHSDCKTEAAFDGWASGHAAIGEIAKAAEAVYPAFRLHFEAASRLKCSTAGGAAKNGPTMARHSAKAGDWRKPTV